MAVDAYIYFTLPDGVDKELKPKGETQDAYFGAEARKAFEIKDFSFDIENATTVGSATGGAGAGKIKFNEFTIKKTVDKASCIFMLDCVTGMHFKNAVIAIRKAGHSTTSAGAPYLEYCFNTVFVTKIEWSGPGDEGPEESITFAYGKLGIRYRQQDEKGKMLAAKRQGWDQQKNVSWSPTDADFSGTGADA